ncbi:MAG TPA: hypothetical protein VMR28_01405 [Candidatus Saccharimonadales bacterium]|nr:hypothetical protein [Candidatus Saccharimonadales bacterium]
MKTITLCSSAAFYEHVNSIATELTANGFKTVVPKTARSMQTTGNYDVTAVKTWYKNSADFNKKAELMRGHFEEVAKGDAVLVVNDEKHGIKGYIGSNVLMEMGLAFYLHKPIYVLNNVDREMPVYEEVLGMNSIILDGTISKIIKKSNA